MEQMEKALAKFDLGPQVNCGFHGIDFHETCTA